MQICADDTAKHRRMSMDLSNPRVDSQLKEQILFQNDQLHYGIYFPESVQQFYGDILWHWHEEFEFGVVTKGSLLYKTNQHEYVLNEGDAVFINSGALHYLHLLVPALEQAKAEEAARIAHRKKPFYEFRLRSIFSELWETIYDRTMQPEMPEPAESTRDIERIKIMLTFMREHCHEKLTVPQIAGCIPVSERECYRLFQNNLGMTPTEFLVSLRLKKARDQLVSTRKNIVEIALESGFGGSSYFSKVFRQEFNLSPGEYRRQNSK